MIKPYIFAKFGCICITKPYLYSSYIPFFDNTTIKKTTLTLRKKYIVFALTFVTIAVVLIIMATKEHKCKSQDYFNALKFYGVVKDKRLDKDQHCIPILVLLDLNEKVELKVDFYLEKTNSYKNLNISDTIFKPSNSDSLYVVKNNVKTLLQKVQFDCVN